MLSVGLGLANGPASSGSTAAVSADQVGQASGISNMARYVGAAVAVAAVAMVNNAVANNHQAAGDSASEALAAGLGELRAADGDPLRRRASCSSGSCAATRSPGHAAVDRAAAAAITTHTIPVQPARLMRERSHRAG